VLAAWAKPFELSEPEFQLLWCLRPLVGAGIDQTSLAQSLSLSTAQVSATVERLRRGGWIVPHVAAVDRRRQFWQLTAAGHALLAKMLVDAERLEAEPEIVELLPAVTTHVQEQAA
jgi:DNA-binding MarR family transcriptional regulator